MSLDTNRLRQIAARLTIWDWLLWFGGGGWNAYTFLAESKPLAGFFALLFFTAGGFQLLAHRWAWHAGLSAWLLGFAAILVLFLQTGLTPWRGVLLACLLWGAWSHYRDRPRYLALARSASGTTEGDADSKSGPEHSLVLLLREPLYLDAALLGRIASRAYGLPFNQGDDCECFVVGSDDKPAPYIMRLQDAWFIIHHWQRPYFEDPEAVAGDFRELRRATAVREHRSWFSVDFLRPSGELPDSQIHDAIGRLLSEIAALDGAEVLAVCHPATRRLIPWEPGFREKLGGGDPLSIFESSQVPVIRVDANSPAMAAAVAEARRRWPEFIAAFHAAASKERFAVKAPVTEGGNTEFIWIEAKAIVGDQIHGLLANDPVALGDLKLGSFVSVAVSELNDWACPDPSDPDRPLGLFTVNAVREARQARA